MDTVTGNWVSKVHPVTRGAEADDPMELVATPVEGDPDVMLECILQEFIWMGWTAEQLFGLFGSPLYPVLNELMAYYGEEQVRARIHALLGQSGTFRFREVLDDTPEPDDEPELIQLSLRKD